MKYIISLVIFQFFLITISAQPKNSSSIKNEVQNFIGFSPSKAKTINGLGVKFWDEDFSNKKINGIEFGLNPLGIFFPFMTIIHSIPPYHHEPPTLSKTYNLKITNGIQFGLSNLEKGQVNGLEFNISGNFNTIINGISISPSINKHYKVSGLSFAILGNFDAQVNGIQIGLFNKTNKLKGLQIGLWNKNNKRSFPFINWNF
ncbi:LA_2272 family surface repeat-containing protein [Polaribacter sp.]|uniref:LA_2272 family surface repeat-containing protein n=1 Tax=Polaribacter sp. TaxID=1920175 RepID=UPI003F6C2BBD